MTIHLAFDDVALPVRLDGAPDIVGLIRAVLPQWPFREVSLPTAQPFFTIRATDKGRFIAQDILRQRKPRNLDGLNAVCDLVAAMPFALLSDKPDFICLHAAAVETSGRLIVIPDARRGGKSTLTAELAKRGLNVFSDDFLPVKSDSLGRLVGRASGANPRLRLPLPPELGPGFRDWVTADPGPENGQYKYLALPDLPASGTLAPLGAIVLLDRDDTSAAALTRAEPIEAMDRLLYQNFMREVHSADILGLLARVVQSLPVLNLRYSDARDAADLLETQFGAWSDVVPSDPALANGFSKAELDIDRPPIDLSDARIFRRDGAAMAKIGEALYISDPEGGGIHRLDPLSQAIWTFLETPTTLAEVCGVLTDSFPDADPAIIDADVRRFLQKLMSAGLLSEA